MMKDAGNQPRIPSVWMLYDLAFGSLIVNPACQSFPPQLNKLCCCCPAHHLSPGRIQLREKGGKAGGEEKEAGMALPIRAVGHSSSCGAPPTKTTLATSSPTQPGLGVAAAIPCLAQLHGGRCFFHPLVSPHPTPACPTFPGDSPFPLRCLSHLLASLSSCTISLDKARHFLLDSQLQVSSSSRGLQCQVVLP